MDRLYAVHGTKPKEMTIDLLNYISPFDNRSPETRFGIKPNLVCSTPASHGATTHPEIVEGIILYLFQKGFKNIKILEGSWVGDNTEDAYEVCGYNKLSEKYGIELIDLKKDSYVMKTYKGLDINICKSLSDIDCLINVPLIKGHCQTKITCALKNLKGLIPDKEKRRFHTLGLHKPIAYLNKLIKQDLIIADAICPDPYFEEGGSPKQFNRIIAGFDPVLMDSYAANVLGYETQDIKYITIAEEEGIGQALSSLQQIIEINNNPLKEHRVEQKQQKYLNIIDEADACSACYSNLASALTELDRIGLTNTFAENICIGQAYRGYKGTLGAGDCTSSFEKFIPGCPPSIDEIVSFLKSYAFCHSNTEHFPILHQEEFYDPGKE